MNQFRLVTMIARTTPGTHNPRNSAQTVRERLVKLPPYTMYVLYAAFLFWPSICNSMTLIATFKKIQRNYNYLEYD